MKSLWSAYAHSGLKWELELPSKSAPGQGSSSAPGAQKWAEKKRGHGQREGQGEREEKKSFSIREGQAITGQNDILNKLLKKKKKKCDPTAKETKPRMRGMKR